MSEKKDLAHKRCTPGVPSFLKFLFFKSQKFNTQNAPRNCLRPQVAIKKIKE